MSKVSVIMSTGGSRPAVLDNTLKSWSMVKSEFDFTLILNDVSNEEIKDVADKYQFVTYKCTDAESLPPNVIWAREGKKSAGDYVVFAMADILLGNYDILEQMLSCDPLQRSSALTYYTDELEMSLLHTIDWVSNPKLIEDLPSFWTHTAVPTDPVPNQDGHDATITAYLTGATREYWDWIGWFREDELGYMNIDTDLVHRERFLGKKATVTGVAYHQWHPRGKIEEKHKVPLHVYETELQARLLEPAKLGQ